MKLSTLAEKLQANSYPGRGIVLGRSSDGKKAVIGYFIMGRSENSRNRIFVEEGEGIRTEAFDPAKLEDPSLIIYAPVRVVGKSTIVTNGDQTDTIRDYLEKDGTFEEALRTRTFEPDMPNYTPRISGIVELGGNDNFSYKLSILKSAEGNGDATRRFFYEYKEPLSGQGHLIHTYLCDGNPIPSFEGEPSLVEITGEIDQFTEQLWQNLNADNKVSLFTRYIDLATGKTETRIVNKNQK